MTKQNTTSTTTIDASTIDNVQEWYRATRPTEYQINDIDPTLTFSWLGENFCNRSECSERLYGLDTMVRENIYHEALVRKLRALKAEGKTQRDIAEFVQKMVNYGGYTTYGVKCAFEDANLVW